MGKGQDLTCTLFMVAPTGVVPPGNLTDGDRLADSERLTIAVGDHGRARRRVMNKPTLLLDDPESSLNRVNLPGAWLPCRLRKDKDLQIFQAHYLGHAAFLCTAASSI